MSKLGCHCGFIISNSTYPAPTEGAIRPQESNEEFQEKFANTIVKFFSASATDSREVWIKDFFNPEYPLDLSDNEVVTDILSKLELPFMRSICECSNCGRLYIQKSPGKNEYECFEPQSGRYNSILKK